MAAPRFRNLRLAVRLTLILLGLLPYVVLGSGGTRLQAAGAGPSLDSVQLTPGWSFESNQSGALAGYWTAAAGDVNGDGYDDILVGALYYDGGQTDEGKAFLFLGSAIGPSTTPSWSFECNQAGARCGEVLTGTGDVNGDGYDDVLVGALYYDNGQTDEGRAYLFLGSAAGLSATPAWTQEGNQAGAGFGMVGRAGDVNGDGYDDVLVTAHFYDNPEPDEGKAFLYFGSPTGPGSTPAWTGETNQSGAVLFANGVGDVNGDGFDDILLGSRAYDSGQVNEGKVFLYLGSPSGPGGTPTWTAESNQAGAQFGFISAAAGDVNADGYGDVLVISDLFDDLSLSEGAAFLWLGGPSGKILLGINGTPSNADWKVGGDQDSAFLRWGGGIGDFDSDGFDDIVVGLGLFDHTLGDEGSVRIYRGSASGLSTQPAWVAYGGRSGARFGWTAEGAGDVNGDGSPDVLVGAETLTNGQTSEGGAFVIFGLPPPCQGPDEDGDGFRICTDCDDTNASIHPGAVEVCNGLDDDCDIATDETIDQDADGFSACSGDCVEGNPSIHPGAAEACNGLDDDCDGVVDEGFPADADGDGYRTCRGDCDDGNAAVHPGAMELCNLVDDDCDAFIDEGFDLDNDGVTTCAGDCNDTSPAIHPGATELCNHVDDDCDGSIDDGIAPDADGDGFRVCDGDCNDANPAIRPGLPELCNQIDDNCNGTIDEGYPDFDHDGITGCAGDCNDSNAAIRPGATELCNHLDDDCDQVVDEGFTDADADGYAVCAGDCNDGNSAIHPGAAETCNGIDDDCNNSTDEALDLDVDGFSTCTGDCNDGLASVHPGAAEVCNGLDDDCDGATDEGFPPDADGDGYRTCAGDCNDDNPAIHPGALELCNGVNDDCDAATDEGFDRDGDGYTACGGDCNDGSGGVHPGAVETCNNVDDDCDGTTDEGFEPDLDGDGFRICEGDCNDGDPAIHPGARELCNQIDDDCDNDVADEFSDIDADGYSVCSGDCNDTAYPIHPGASESCNLTDDDCDGILDDGFDQDADGFTSCGGDCNDANGAIHPGAGETCNGVDDDCSGLADDAPDVDGDGVGACFDCSESNPMVWLPPMEVQNVEVWNPVGTYLSWDDQGWIGPETIYDVSSATFGPGFGISLSGASCLQAGVPAYPYYEDNRPDPSLNNAYWYLARARNSCGVSGYGTNHLGQERTLPVCP